MRLVECAECGCEIRGAIRASYGARRCGYCGLELVEDYSHRSQRRYIGKPNVCYISCIPFDLTRLKDELLSLPEGDLDGTPYEHTMKTIIEELLDSISNMSKLSANSLINEIRSTREVPEYFDGQMGVRLPNRVRSDKLCCPRCGSSHVAIGHRGYSIISGFWGSNRTMNRCGMCGYRWEPRR